jgi:hypothetical protein
MEGTMPTAKDRWQMIKVSKLTVDDHFGKSFFARMQQVAGPARRAARFWPGLVQLVRQA